VLHSIEHATVDNDEVIWLKAKSGPHGDNTWKQKLMNQANQNITTGLLLLPP